MTTNWGIKLTMFVLTGLQLKLDMTIWLTPRVGDSLGGRGSQPGQHPEARTRAFGFPTQRGLCHDEEPGPLCRCFTGPEESVGTRFDLRWFLVATTIWKTCSFHVNWYILSVLTYLYVLFIYWTLLVQWLNRIERANRKKHVSKCQKNGSLFLT